jgi:hypothetical protein
VKELTIGRWEKGQSEIPVSAEAIVRMLFAETTTGRKGRVKEVLDRIADLEDEIDRTIRLDTNNGQWAEAA